MRRLMQQVSYAKHCFDYGSRGCLAPDVYGIHEAAVDAVAGLTQSELLQVSRELCEGEYRFRPGWSMTLADQEIDFETLLREMIVDVVVHELEADSKISDENLRRHGEHVGYSVQPETVSVT